MSKQNQTTSPAAAPVTTDPTDVQNDQPAADAPRRTVSIYFPEPLLARLDEVAARLERSRTWVIEKAVLAGLDSLDRDRVQP